MFPVQEFFFFVENLCAMVLISLSFICRCHVDYDDADIFFLREIISAVGRLELQADEFFPLFFAVKSVIILHVLLGFLQSGAGLSEFHGQRNEPVSDGTFVEKPAMASIVSKERPFFLLFSGREGADEESDDAARLCPKVPGSGSLRRRLSFFSRFPRHCSGERWR